MTCSAKSTRASPFVIRNSFFGGTRPQSAPLLVGGPGKLSQVLANLLSNAVKFTLKGYASLSVTSVAYNQQAIEEGSVRIRFLVEDTGIGISPEAQAVIFESYQQASSHISRNFGGTGLGLSIKKKLVSLMGSHMVLSSELGKGSSFSFDLTFPVSKHPSGAENPHTFGKGFRFDLTGVRILLAEDNHLNMQITERLLKKWCAEVDLAHNGQLALEKIQQHAYSLVLMDLQMPGLDGYQTARAIRALAGAHFQEIPFIAFTASSASEVREVVLAAGMKDVFTKPLNPVDLYHKIAEKTILHNTLSVNQAGPQAPLKSIGEGVVNLEPYQEIADGEPDFYEELLSKTNELLSDFWKAYQQSLYDQDGVALGKELHKVRSTLVRLEMNPLLGLLNTAQVGEYMSNETLRTQHLEAVGKALNAVQTAIQKALSENRSNIG